MRLQVEPSRLSGRVQIPGSKSHTIRAVAFASLADGTGRILSPLESADTHAAVDAYRAAGATVEMCRGEWVVTGAAGEIKAPTSVVDVRNSGTTLNVSMGTFALLRDGKATLTGDEQIQRRPSRVLAAALTDLGASAVSMRGNGCAPFEVKGRLSGGSTSMEAVSSQYLSSVLINAPLGDGESRVLVPVLHEAPYVRMTLSWLVEQGMKIEYADDLSEFVIPGGQTYKAFEKAIPADFSSATFFLAAGAMGDNAVSLGGLDINDTQGDKAVMDYVSRMGANVAFDGGDIVVSGRGLSGCEIDLNATPDALPMMACLACFARGTTRLVNVAHARIKETDRIAVMAAELSKMGARVKEMPDGLVIEESKLHGAHVDGHGDHRVVMALAVAASGAESVTTIDGAEAIAVTFETFVYVMRGIGARIAVGE